MLSNRWDLIFSPTFLHQYISTHIIFSIHFTEEILEMFEDAMVENDEQNGEGTEPNERVFVIIVNGQCFIGGRKIIYGRNVENRVIHFLKDAKRDLGWLTKIFVNYDPSKRFVQLLVKSLGDGEQRLVTIVTGRDKAIARSCTEPDDALTVELRTMTAQDWEELENHLKCKSSCKSR